MGRTGRALAGLMVVFVTAACSSTAPVGPSPAPPEADPDVPLVHPLPDPVPAGLGVVLTEFVTLPRSTSSPPADSGDNLDRWNRINYLGEVPDGSGRLFVPDLNGKLYMVTEGVPRVYLDVGAQVGPDFWNHAGLGTGFGFVAFHPDFARNGRFYTVHSEGRGALTAKRPGLPAPQRSESHGVVTEWTAAEPAAPTFAGTRREVLRIGFVGVIHGIQQIGFNPVARPGDPDHGQLYVAVGDGGAAGDAEESLKTTVPSDPALPQGKLLRIDPGGRDGPTGQYGIPASNPFVGRPGMLPEVYASGLRGPYRFSWDTGADHRMFLGNIGNEQVESIYEVQAGDNYGWSEREGPFVVRLGEGKEACDIFPVPADRRRDFVPPVAAYGHNDPPPGWPKCEDTGYAVILGPVYRGDALPELRGKLLFGDGVTGRLFYTDLADMRRGGDHLATVHELTLFDQAGKQVTLEQVAGNDEVSLAGHRKVDLRFGVDAKGEVYLLSKANGKVWRITGVRTGAPPPEQPPRLPTDR